MALIPDFDTKLKDGCKTFSFIDKFDWAANPGELVLATGATITHESSSGVTTVLDVFAQGFPNDTELELDITSLIGESGTTVIANQYFYLTYTVTGTFISGVTQEIKKLTFIDCQAADCVAKKLASIDVCDCDCDTAKVDNAILANTLLKAARQAACCNQTERWTELIDMVMKLCKIC